jgi:hypothetical protein
MEIMLAIIERKMLKLLKAIDIQQTIVDNRYEDRMFPYEITLMFREYNQEIKNLIDDINEIEVQAIYEHNDSIMFECEGKKAKLINEMTILTYKYDM